MAQVPVDSESFPRRIRGDSQYFKPYSGWFLQIRHQKVCFKKVEDKENLTSGYLLGRGRCDVLEESEKSQKDPQDSLR